MYIHIPWRQNPKVHHRIHESPSTIPILRQVNPLHNPPPLRNNLPKVHFDPNPPSTPWSFKLSFSFGLSHQNPFLPPPPSLPYAQPSSFPLILCLPTLALRNPCGVTTWKTIADNFITRIYDRPSCCGVHCVLKTRNNVAPIIYWEATVVSVCSAREQVATFSAQTAYTTPRLWDSVTVHYESAQPATRSRRITHTFLICGIMRVYDQSAIRWYKIRDAQENTTNWRPCSNDSRGERHKLNEVPTNHLKKLTNGESSSGARHVSC
jgi:hypothetical protein